MRSLALACILVVACSTKRDEPKREVPNRPPPMAQPKPPPPCEKPGGTVCVADEVVECLANGQLGTPLSRCNGGCNAGKCVETCAVRDAELVYTVDADNNLMSFDPRKLPGD